MLYDESTILPAAVAFITAAIILFVGFKYRFGADGKYEARHRKAELRKAPPSSPAPPRLPSRTPNLEIGLRVAEAVENNTWPLISDIEGIMQSDRLHSFACPGCGNVFSRFTPDAKFCPRCGKQVIDVEYLKRLPFELSERVRRGL